MALPQDNIFITARFSIPLSELEWQYTRSSGPGGQNVNRTQSAAQLKWNYLNSPSFQALPPTEAWLEKLQSWATKDGSLLFTSQTHRDQKRNAEECVDKLTKLLQSLFYKPKKRIPTRPTRSSQRRRLSTKKVHSDKKSQRKKIQYD